MTKSKSLLLGFMIGGVVGAGTTLISTPTSGQSIRQMLKKQLNEWKKLAKELKFDGKQLKNQLTETSREGALLVKELTQGMRSSVEDWQEIVEPHQENINEYLAQIEMSLKELEDKAKK